MTKPDTRRYVDMTPTWHQILPMMLTALENGDAQARTIMRDELVKMAKTADKYNELISKEKPSE